MAAMDIAVIGSEGGVDMGERGTILVAGKVTLKADQFAGRGKVETVIFLAFIHETVDILSGASNTAGNRRGGEVGLLCQGLQTCVNLLAEIKADEAKIFLDNACNEQIEAVAVALLLINPVLLQAVMVVLVVQV